MIVLVDYDARWPPMFAGEAARIREALGAIAKRIEHVGSTAVPGLVAKPVIDIQVSVASLAPMALFEERLGALGYAHIALDDFDRVYPYFRRPADWPSTHHVHLCEAGGELEERHLLFRDALRRDPTLAARYVKLKRELAARHEGNTHASRESYSLGKTDFIEAVLRETRGA